MNLKTLHFKILAFAVTATTWSFTADAEMNWHWEDTVGSDGDTTVVYSRIVIDGWYGDGTASTGLASRFPNSGKSGLATKSTKTGEIEGRNNVHSCTVAANQAGIKGFLPGNKSWKIYIDSSVPDNLVQGFISNAIAFNKDQEARGNSFRIEPVSWRILADTIISTPSWINPLDADVSFKVARTSSTRSGMLEKTYVTLTTESMTSSEAAAAAASALGAAAGLDFVDDGKYPSVMQRSSTSPVMDACTLAAIDANINSGKNK